MTVLQAQPYDFSLLSPTAIAASYIRQFSDLPYARELAQKVDAQTVFEKYNSQNFLKFSGPYSEAAYKTINRLIDQFGYTQIIELASGLLPRGMEMSEKPNITFFESDLPDLINLKKQLVTELIGERANLHFAAIEVTSIPSQFPIHSDYLHVDEEVTILSEGLLIHLTFPEKERMCANIRDVLSQYGGVWITPDIVTKEMNRRIQENLPPKERLFQKVSEKTNRNLINHIFNDIAHARQFFTEQGFCIEEYNVTENTEELSSLELLGVDSDFFKRIFSDNSVFALTLKV